MSLRPIGMPCSGPRYLPAAISASVARASWRAVSASTREAVEPAVEPRDAVQPAVDQFNRRQLTFLDQPRRRDNLVALALRHSEPEPRQSRIEFRLGHVSLPNFDRPR